MSTKSKRADRQRSQEDHDVAIRGRLVNAFGHFSEHAAKASGSPLAFVTALAVIVTWGVTGPVFGFSDTWQLVINTGTTIVTFLMVFVIQSAQNRDTAALQVKLDELLEASHREEWIDIEDLDETELERLQKRMKDRYGAIKPGDSES